MRVVQLTFLLDFLYPLQKVINVVKELRDNKVGASVDFGLEVIDFGVFVNEAIRMSVGIGCRGRIRSNKDWGETK